MKKKDKEKHLDNGKPDERENFDATDNKEVKPDGETRDEPEEKEDRDELSEKYLRLYSEFENYRKRNARERLELIQTAGEEIMTTLLPVLDDFERAIHFNKESSDQQAIVQGVELIYQKFRTTLEQRGLKERNPMGEKFDMDKHEAVAKIKAPSKKKKGKILEVVEKGYALGEKVIRFPKVVVGE